MTRKGAAMFHKSAPPRHAAPTKRPAHVATVLLLALAVVCLTSHFLSACYASWSPHRSSGALVNGAMDASFSRAVGSRISMLAEPEVAEVLKISKTTKVGKLAQVLKNCVLDPKRASTYGLCRGGNATNVALKSVIIANRVLEETASQLSSDGVGKRIVTMPTIVEREDKGELLKMQELHFQLAPIGPVPQGAAENVLIVGMRTNTGKLAGAMLGRIEQYGEAVLTMIGDSAIYNAVLATAIAVNLTNNGNPTGAVRLALLPAFYNVTQPEKRTGVEMRCFKV